MGMIRQGFEREEFLLPQAQKAGYSSNADMWVDIAMELYQKTEAIVKCVMTSLISKWMDDCRYYDFETLNLPTGDVAITFTNAD